MKNVNVSVDEETWKAARILAAKRDTSVSALVREALRQMTVGETSTLSEEERDRQEREQLADLLKESNLVLGYSPTREKTYER